MNNYKTTDIILTAALKQHGYEMTNIEINGSKGTFCFEEVDQEFLNDFDLGKCRVEPVSFNNTIKQLTTSVRRMTR